MDIQTKRLLLRQWRPTDLQAFASLNADPEVMEFFPALLTREQSDAIAHKIMRLIDQRGWGFWALDIPGVTAFAGFVGLHVPEHDLPFCPCVEIGWRLAREHWGKGYATEAAMAALDFGFGELGLAEVVAFTAAGNLRSQRVMQRLGMTRDDAGFEHPAIEIGNPLRPHVLYRIAAPNPQHKQQGPVT